MRYISLWLVLSLCACNLSSVRPPTTSQVPAGVQIENWRGGTAEVTAQFHGDGGASEVASGTLSAAGKLAFTFKPIREAHLARFASCPGVTVSHPALRLNAFSALNVTSGGVRQGRVALASRSAVVNEGLARAGDYYLQYTYADRAARIEGRCANTAPSTFSYALDLTPGWNLVVFKLTAEGVLHLSSGPIPKEATWFFSEVAL